MPTPDVPYRFEVELEVTGSPEQVWAAIASAEGISAWMMPAEFDARLGGAVAFHMGPGEEETSEGTVTAFEPGQRLAYEEDWAALTGHAGAAASPLMTEFVVEARSGGTCVVRVVTSAFGSGAEWEQEFWDEMETGWAPVLDNLRLYLAHFPGQQATPLWVSSRFTVPAAAAIGAVRSAMGIGAVGEEVAVRDVTGTLERSLDHHFLVRTHRPVPGLLSCFAFGTAEDSAIHLQGHLFSPEARAYVEREQASWQRWLDALAGEATAEPAR
jgi:uncharacterized protein YndB with AHSA1/START domain